MSPGVKSIFSDQFGNQALMTQCGAPVTGFRGVGYQLHGVCPVLSCHIDAGFRFSIADAIKIEIIGPRLDPQAQE